MGRLEFAGETLAEEITTYWNGRATSYSNGVRGELSDYRKDAWLNELHALFDVKLRELEALELTARAIDLGCGPGFFSILLSGMGCVVDAVDASAEMIERAKANIRAAGAAQQVTFHESDVCALPFEDNTFDIAASRNLTWLMRNPEGAYREWLRVLKPGGIMVVFDANWYRYLVDADVNERRVADQSSIMLEGWDWDAQATSDEEKRCEQIAALLPLTPVRRPGWDVAVLKRLGASEVIADEAVGKRVWTQNEQDFYASSPLFLVKAVK